MAMHGLLQCLWGRARMMHDHWGGGCDQKQAAPGKGKRALCQRGEHGALMIRSARRGTAFMLWGAGDGCRTASVHVLHTRPEATVHVVMMCSAGGVGTSGDAWPLGRGGLWLGRRTMGIAWRVEHALALC